MFEFVGDVEEWVGHFFHHPGVPVPTTVAVVNKSNLVTDAEAVTMVAAVNLQLRFNVAPGWGRVPMVVQFVGFNEVHAPAHSYLITIFDDADQAGDLGWHSEAPGGAVYGKVFARPTLENGGHVLGGPLAVASVLSHEVIEAFIDPSVNLWADKDGKTAVALEAGDPVESDSYVIAVAGEKVSVSNFVLPAWFDPNAAPNAQRDMLNTTPGPFRLSSGGYMVVETEHGVSQQFGERYPEWRKATKEFPASRTARRIKATTPPA